MLWIISGPSSVGKSTFIESRRCSEITGLPPKTEVLFPDDQKGKESLSDSGCLLHYNILRCVDILHGDSIRRQPAAEMRVLRPSFSDDPGWRSILEWPGNKQAIVLIASRQMLLQRIRGRSVIESAALTGQPEVGYPSQHWERLVKYVDLGQFYQEWRHELIARGIPYLLVDSTDNSYRIIDDSEADRLLSHSTPYTKNQIEELLRQHSFEYQRIELPFGLNTQGDDRSSTRDLIYPSSFQGESVLDVGSALGYFCFEAEERGAAQVVGYEPKARRYEQACLLKEIKESKVEFRNQDILQHPPSEQFDHVLMLNVIHHLKDPIQAIRQLASITRKRLVVEFPTLADAKFRSTTKLRLPFRLNRLPLIGVSSLSGADQTFVFTNEAIRRVVLDHEPLFAEVEFLPSPIKSRTIAICHR